MGFYDEGELGGIKKGRQIMCRPEIVERKKFSFLSLCL